jgi:hypothetical protein
MMIPRGRFRTVFLSLGVIAAIAASALILIPWKMEIARRLEHILEAKGFQNMNLTLSKLGPGSATIRDVTVGDGNLALKNLVIHYSPLELWKGNLRGLEISDLSLEIRREEGAWAVSGFKGRRDEPGPVRPLTIPAGMSIPFDLLSIKNSQVNIAADTWTMSVPAQLEWQKIPAPEISAESKSARFDRAGMSAVAAALHMQARSGPEGWDGKWDVRGLQIKADSFPLPEMAGEGTIRAGAEKIELEGRFKSGDGAYQAAFHLDYPLSADAKPVLILTHAAMPWKGGTIETRNVAIPVGGAAKSRPPVRIVLQARGVSVDELMQALTGKRVTATGAVSGTLPLTLERDGSVSLGEGDLQATGPGIITMPPDLIPGDNEQVVLTRQILRNFHYRELSVAVDHGAGRDVSLILALEGNNPDVYDGRPVKLNVRLTGDVLDFIQQNAMFIKDPKAMLKQGQK